MLTQEIIHAKREGKHLAAEDIASFVRGMMDDSVTEGQVAALAMAVFFQGLDRDECVALTSSLRDSGTVLQWPEMPGPVVDKHSTGGVGDKVSLIQAPLLAACGAYVPMISGRGLGHTGGTLDKMESIAGYNATPDNNQFQQVVKQVGCAIVGQTASLAPADKRFYGIRDVTATVESIPLITASILSKKLSAGLDNLVMDIKCGSGAFANSLEMARDLAKSIIEVAHGLGLSTSALITDMDQVLGLTAGNALEVEEVAGYLLGEHLEPRLHEVVIQLSADLLVRSKISADLQLAEETLNQTLDSGRAAEYFSKMVAALGGPGDFLKRRTEYLPSAEVILPVYPALSNETLMIESIDTRAVGNVVVALGGGRTRPQDSVDHSVGLSDIKGIGEVVGKDQPLAFVHAKTQDDADFASNALRNAITLGAAGDVNPNSIIIDRLQANEAGVVEL